MKICAKCGQPAHDDSDEFCTKCGAYFVDPKTGKEQVSPMSAALGMVNPQVRDKAVPVREGGTVSSGVDHMATGNYAEAMAQWVSYVRENGQPSEEDYRRMVDSTVDCMFRTIGSGKLESRAGIADLAMELDEDIMSDLNTGILAKVPEMTAPKQIADTSSECMYLVLESFNVYPDLRDVIEVMDGVPVTMDALAEALGGMEVPEGDRTADVLQVHKDYSNMIGDIMRSGVEAAGEERMDALADYWASKANLPYINVIYQSASMHSQLSMAQNVGKLTKKLLTKGLNLQLEAFKKSYFDVKL